MYHARVCVYVCVGVSGLLQRGRESYLKYSNFTDN